MDLIIASNPDLMGREAAAIAASDLVAAISQAGSARLLVATGASQFTVLDHLCGHEEIDWTKIDGFHLDEYEGISSDHPASFCRYLKERFVDRVPLRSFHFFTWRCRPWYDSPAGGGGHWGRANRRGDGRHRRKRPPGI